VALLLESYYTIWMEALLPKRRILELYANVIEMGRGIYGVEAASQHYFGVSSHGLTRGAVGHADGCPAESEGLGSGEAEQDIALAPATYFAP
jgi:monofunctional biosynthetic peptidoglycan transglycosylase